MAFFPGLGGGAGFGKSINLDVDGGVFGGAGGGVPVGSYGQGMGSAGSSYGGGWGGIPYVPVTPLGALGGVKGDLIVPIVAVGLAIFLLVIIVMAVKAALAWKLSLLSGLANKKYRRDTMNAGGPPQEDQLNSLAEMVLSAIQSQTCAQNMICQIGSYARTQQGLPSLLRILEGVVPSSIQEPMVILRSSAEGSFNCDEKYNCKNSTKTHFTTSTTPTPTKATRPLTQPVSNSL